MKRNKTCKHCKKEYTTRKMTQKYCSNECVKLSGVRLFSIR